MEQNTDSQDIEENQTSQNDTGSSNNQILPKIKELLLSSYSKFVARKAIFYLVVVFFSVSLVFVVTPSR